MRLSQIDDSNRSDHARLTADDQCFYIYEYTSGRDYNFSATNNLISNLKKRPTSSEPQLRYKRKAIRNCSDALREVIQPAWLDSATLVPVPGSKAADHPDYDPRMEQVARGIRDGLDVRNLVIQRQSTAAAHETDDRVTVEELLELYEIDEQLLTVAPRVIGIIDDVLTAGTHFRAMRAALNARLPCVPVVGIFIARRVFPNPFAVEA